MEALEEIAQTIQNEDNWIDSFKMYLDKIYFELNHHIYGEITLKHVLDYIKNGRN